MTEKFGYNTISYNSSKVDPADMQDLATVWSEKYKGRISIYDYYLPVMGLWGFGAWRLGLAGLGAAEAREDHLMRGLETRVSAGAQGGAGATLEVA